MAGFYAHATAALDAWGAWARRPQMWAPLRWKGNFALIPVARISERVETPDYTLDPQSRRTHIAVLGMPDLPAGVLWAHYVRLRSFAQEEATLRRFGICTAQQFDELLREATVTAWMRARALPVAA